MTEIDSYKTLRELSTGEIADLYIGQREEGARVSERIDIFNTLIRPNTPISAEILDVMRTSLEEERTRQLAKRAMLDSDLPTKRVRDTALRSWRDFDGAIADEARLLATDGSLPEEWLAIYKAYGDDAPEGTYDAIASKIEVAADLLRDKIHTLGERATRYSVPLEDWPVMPEITPNDTPDHLDLPGGVIVDMNKNEAIQPPQDAPHATREAARAAEQDASKKVIELLISRYGEPLSYAQIAAEVYPDGSNGNGKRDNRIGTLFHNNLVNPRQSNAFAEYLEEGYVLIKGKRVPIDPQTGKPPQKYKPLVTYMVLTPEEAAKRDYQTLTA